MGDFNAKIGANTKHTACGMFGLGETNERCDLLLDWLDDNKLFAVTLAFSIESANVTLGVHRMAL